MTFYFANIELVRIFMSQKKGTELVPRYLMAYVTIFEGLWTHGFLKSYSDFLFQSISLHWYYNSKKRQNESYSGFS